MIVMPSNTRGIVTGWLMGKWEGRVGHLFSPGGYTRSYPFAPFALDNGKFPVWQKGLKWDGDAYVGLLDRVKDSGASPSWVLVPDVVADRDGTLREWDVWCHRLSQYGWPLAFAAQDGMEADDVPSEAAVVFVGGTTEWKRRTMHGWCSEFDRVHVGRINTSKWLWECHEAGAESCDGTGWMRGDQDQFDGLVDYLTRTTDGSGNPRGGSLFIREETNGN